jgi:hypothetical protein
VKTVQLAVDRGERQQIFNCSRTRFTDHTLRYQHISQKRSHRVHTRTSASRGNLNFCVNPSSLCMMGEDCAIMSADELFGPSGKVARSAETRPEQHRARLTMATHTESAVGSSFSSVENVTVFFLSVFSGDDALSGERLRTADLNLASMLHVRRRLVIR